MLRGPQLDLPRNRNPEGKRCIQITIPDDDEYERELFSTIERYLCYWFNWERSADKAGKDIAEIWREALLTFRKCSPAPSPLPIFGEDEEMPSTYEPYCRDDGSCGFHFRCDICGSWHDVATKDDLIIAPSGANNQPAPGGGTANYCGVLQANGAMLIPIPVNTGDKIEIVSVTGHCNDGVEADWRCADGNIFYIDCTPAGAIVGVSGDPITGAPHMSVIVAYTSTYDQLYPGGSVIVRAGISNVQPALIVNMAASGLKRGTLNICVKITNNQTATWTRTLDFTLSPNGFVNIPISGVNYGTWVPGQGWESEPDPAGGSDYRVALIHRTFGATHLTSASITASQNPAATGGGAGNSVVLRLSGSTVATVCLGHVYTGTLTDSWTGSQSVDEILINPSGNGSPLFIEIQMVLTGTGTPPF